MDFALTLGTFLTLAYFLSVGVLAHVVVSHLWSQGPLPERMCASLVVSLIVHTVGFYILAAVGQFRLLGALAFLIAIIGGLLWSWKRGGKKSLHEAYRGIVREFTGGWRNSAVFRWSLIMGGAMILVNLTRELAIPPLAWDSLTYQLTRPAMWVQEGGYTDYTAPGQWLLYKYRFPLGNILTAWALVFTRSDILVPLLWTGVGAVGGLGTYVGARRLGASRAFAMVAAWIAVTTPALAAHMFTAHVDNLVAAVAVLAFVLFLYAEDQRSFPAAAFAFLGLVGGLLTKKTALPFLGMGGILLLRLWVRSPRERRLRWLLGAVVVAAIVVLPFLAYLWADTGSPVYPYEIRIGGETIFPGGPFADGMSSHGRERPLMRKLTGMFFRGYGSPLHHINFGPIFPLVVLVALYGMGKAIWRGEFRWTTACMGFAAIFVFAFVIYSPTGSGLNEARYAAAATLVFLPFAAAINRRGILVVLLAAFAANLFYLVPLQWTSDDVFAAGAFAVAIVPFLLVAALMARYLWQRGRKEAGIAVAALITYCSLAFALEPIRQMFRHDIYTQASRARTYSNFPVGGNHGQSFLSASIFEHVDQEEPLRLAVTVGWDGRGINWFVYPLLGSRLQNRLDYVPVAKDGSLPPYKVWQRATVKGSYQAWYERIRAGGYDYVATFAPATMELSWMQRHPEAFELVAVGDHPANRLYLVKDR